MGFDKNVETLFDDRQTNEEIDQIFESLFVNNSECYAEEECDKDSVLVYGPSPNGRDMVV